MLTRFAPSPTGYLHIGNARTALLTWMYSKKFHGDMILRIDDTGDTEEKYKSAIFENLSWLGITWSKTFSQSDNMKRYSEIIEHLKSINRIYPCYETQDELNMWRKLLAKSGFPPIYRQKTNVESKNRRPHWRFRIDTTKRVKWNDIVAGNIEFDPEKLSDPIIIRENDTPTYMLPSVIDDIDSQITDIIRGNDHISNTAIQIQMFEILSKSIPNFAHISLVGIEDSKISKRDENEYELRKLQEKQIEPLAICNYLFNLGRSVHLDSSNSVRTLIDNLDLSLYSGSKVKTKISDIEVQNKKFIQQLSYDKLSYKFVELGITEDFWLFIKYNISSLNEVISWWNICKNNLIFKQESQEDIEYLTVVKDSLPDYGIFDDEIWEKWISEIKTKTKRSGKSLFSPIRLSLTGKKYGPDLIGILKFIDRDIIINRLSQS